MNLYFIIILFYIISELTLLIKKYYNKGGLGGCVPPMEKLTIASDLVVNKTIIEQVKNFKNKLPLKDRQSPCLLPHMPSSALTTQWRLPATAASLPKEWSGGRSMSRSDLVIMSVFIPC